MSSLICSRKQSFCKIPASFDLSTRTDTSCQDATMSDSQKSTVRRGTIIFVAATCARYHVNLDRKPGVAFPASQEEPSPLILTCASRIQALQPLAACVCQVTADQDRKEDCLSFSLRPRTRIARCWPNIACYLGINSLTCAYATTSARGRRWTALLTTTSHPLGMPRARWFATSELSSSTPFDELLGLRCYLFVCGRRLCSCGVSLPW